MAKSILAASPDAAFGETLRTGLQETGGYTVQLALNGAEVLSSIGNLAFDIAILDSLISDFPLPSLVDAVRLKLPEVRVLVIPPTDPFSALTLEECGADSFINKPVFIPDLLETIRGLSTTQPGQDAPGEETPFAEPPAAPQSLFSQEIAKVDWDSDQLPESTADEYEDTLVLPLEDVIAETQPQISIKSGPKKNTGALQEIPPEQFLEMEELAKWFSESTARSAMLVSGGGVIATSGEIDAEAEKKFAREVVERFQASEARELIRYVPPQHGSGSELLFAASLGEAKYLVLTYAADTSYTLIRQQAERLRKRLSELAIAPTAPPEEVSKAWSPEASTSGETGEPASQPVQESVETGRADQDLFPIPGDHLQDESAIETSPEVPVPPPDEGETQPPQAEVLTVEASLDLDRDFPPVATGQAAEPGPDPEVYPWQAAGAAAIAGFGETEENNLAEGVTLAGFPWEDKSPQEEPPAAPLASPSPGEVTAPESDGLAEPTPGGEMPTEYVMETPGEKINTAELALRSVPEGGTSDLRVFLFVPADPRVFLTGKLGGELGGWIPQVCQSLGWEVDALAVRPESVRLGLIAPPDQKDDMIVSMIQDATARLVASNYPQMALDPEKPLFWADDFLRINPTDPPDQNELNAFIRHLRR